MIKKIKTFEEKHFCDICGEELGYSEYKAEEDNPKAYELCSDHQKMYELAKIIADDNVVKARELLESVLDQMNENRQKELLEIFVVKVKELLKHKSKKKEE